MPLDAVRSLPTPFVPVILGAVTSVKGERVAELVTRTVAPVDVAESVVIVMRPS